MATFFRFIVCVASLAILCERAGISLESFAVAEQAAALEAPGFENAEAWDAAVKQIVEKDDAALLKRVFAVGEGRLDGYYSTNYSYHLSRIAVGNTRLFLRVADEVYGPKLERPMRYLVNESRGYPRELKRSLQAVPKGTKEHAIAKRFLALADAKAKRLGK